MMMNLRVCQLSAPACNGVLAIVGFALAPPLSMPAVWASSHTLSGVVHSSSQTSNTIEIAQFNFFKDLVETVVDVPEPVTEVLNAIEAEQIRQGEAEAAQQAAAEAQAEAEIRYQHFERLTPEEKRAYIAEQRGREAAQAEAAATLLLMMLAADGGSGSEAEGCEYVPYVVNGVYQGDICQ